MTDIRQASVLAGVCLREPQRQTGQQRRLAPEEPLQWRQRPVDQEVGLCSAQEALGGDRVQICGQCLEYLFHASYNAR
ncbi:hypothetical protein [Mycobacteroides abscessus]|uniref:hypothetical protein n=1 Tax=Mycobacteroides abscessus TaxID=36809 RepID=UPI00266F49DD|nr:hypothetical protein [Mycobacteroides abscessus]MDO3107066.1 hypothetical protein [Mycobacteroides abscessus subsp. abscessus]